VYSEWVRVDPVRGRLVDAAALVDPSAARLDGADGCVRLCGAKNEYVSFQVIVRSADRIGEIRLRFAGLDGPRGRRIGAGEFEPHAQWYHDLGKPTGWVPDALVPLRRVPEPVGLPWKVVDVPGQTVQGFWIDVFVPKDAVKGRYTGKLTVSCDGSRHDVPIELDVGGRSAPSAPGTASSRCDGGDTRSRGDGTRHDSVFFRILDFRSPRRRIRETGPTR
jgi:hypothetical protein